MSIGGTIASIGIEKRNVITVWVKGLDKPVSKLGTDVIIFFYRGDEILFLNHCEKADVLVVDDNCLECVINLFKVPRQILQVADRVVFRQLLIKGRKASIVWN